MVLRISQEIPASEENDARKIAFVGLDQAGKTTTLRRLSRGVFTEPKPTLGFSTEILNFLGLKFNVFDLGGQDTFHVFWEKFLPQQEAVVFFIDSEDMRRLPEVRIALSKTLSLVKLDTVFMVLANKQDLPNALNVRDLIATLDLRLASKLKSFHLAAVSAKTGIGLYDAFQWLASTLEDTSHQKCTIYGFSVYEKDVGIALFTTFNIFQNADHETTFLRQDPELMTALHSAIGTYVSEMAGSELQSVIFREPRTKQVFRIFSVRYKNLVCMIVTPEGDSEIVANTLGLAIIKVFIDKQGSTATDRLKDFSPVELFNVVKPFIRNADELKASLSIQEQSEDSSIPPTEDITSVEDEKISPVSLSNNLILDSSSVDENRSPPSHFSESRSEEYNESPSQPNDSGDLVPSEEDFPSGMPVAERIKRLQKSRRRLQDD